MDVLLNGLSKSAKGELPATVALFAEWKKTMSLRCHLLATNGWSLND